MLQVLMWKLYHGNIRIAQHVGTRDSRNPTWQCTAVTTAFPTVVYIRPYSTISGCSGRDAGYSTSRRNAVKNPTHGVLSRHGVE